jgi:hypothetical protein
MFHGKEVSLLININLLVTTRVYKKNVYSQKRSVATCIQKCERNSTIEREIFNFKYAFANSMDMYFLRFCSRLYLSFLNFFFALPVGSVYYFPSATVLT